jgi:hypothetical protein
MMGCEGGGTEFLANNQLDALILFNIFIFYSLHVSSA